eukprot:COSAG01_NODE_10224_length_2216_cov_265.183278_3_plen_358_part_01
MGGSGAIVAARHPLHPSMYALVLLLSSVRSADQRTGSGAAPAQCAEQEEDRAGGTVDVTADGGVRKLILTGGEGELPASGSVISARYTGWLEGGSAEPFDRGNNFTFKLGRGAVVIGWELAFATMRMREVANLTIQHDYGYGTQGLPPRVPPYATLLFEVEVLAISEAGAGETVGGDGETLALPSEPSVPEGGQGTRVVTVDGSPVKIDRLGPIVVNRDGSLSRITNWAQMSEREQRRTLKVIGRRNRMRMGQLEKGDIWEDAEDGATSAPRAAGGAGRAPAAGPLPDSACASHPCANGATCSTGPAETSLAETFVCSCAIGFYSPRCQRETDECYSLPCKHGTCYDRVAAYSCQCAE